MKYILWRECSLYTKSERFFVTHGHNKVWETSKAAFDIIAFCSTARSMREIMDSRIGSGDNLSQLLDNLIRARILVKESDDEAKLLDTMHFIKKNGDYDIYYDTRARDDLLVEYCAFIDHIVQLIDDKFDIRLRGFNICLFFDRGRYKQMCGSVIPKWATCFVCQDCLIQRAGEKAELQAIDTRHSKLNMREMLHEIGHIISYKYCRHLPNWLSEGISEYIADTLFPCTNSKNIKCNSLYKDLLFFLNNPKEMLITYDSHRAHENKLYLKAALLVKKLLRNRDLKSLLSVLSCYDFLTPIDRYLTDSGFDLSPETS